MIEKLKKVIQEIKDLSINSAEELEVFRIKYLSRKGIINDLFEEFKAIPNEQKKDTGKVMNELKQITEFKFNESQVVFGKKQKE